MSGMKEVLEHYHDKEIKAAQAKIKEQQQQALVKAQPQQTVQVVPGTGVQSIVNPAIKIMPTSSGPTVSDTGVSTNVNPAIKIMPTSSGVNSSKTRVIKRRTRNSSNLNKNVSKTAKQTRVSFGTGGY